MHKASVYLDTNLFTVRPNNSKEQLTMADVLVDEIRRVREELIEQYGGIEAYFRHCQQQDRAGARGLKAGRRKQPTRKGRKTLEPRDDGRRL